MQVMVLAGGLSAERDVSLRSGRRVAEALRSARPDWEVHERDVDAALLSSLADNAPDCVVPLLHGAAGEDGAVRDVLECLGLPYVGSRPNACRLSFDKAVAKTLVRRAGVATPEWVALPHATFRELGAPAVMAALERGLGFPLVVKPTRGGSALGVSVVRTPDELPAAMVGAFAYGDVALLERFVEGTEVAVGVIETADGPVALPAVEIVPDGGLYDYSARYTAGTTQFYVPARLDDAVAAAAAEAALTVHRTLGLRDWSRSDLIVSADGTVNFLEVNVAPGMTETSLVPQALTAAGIDMGAQMAALVDRAIARV
ncbi:MAG: D-alanine--D-alanine ligase [Actinomycetales bacterium mxb001]|nr:MAG: D-alanine--D-alanine ligase [Actinomycetales bacterium mxb001]